MVPAVRALRWRHSCFTPERVPTSDAPRAAFTHQPRDVRTLAADYVFKRPILQLLCWLEYADEHTDAAHVCAELSHSSDHASLMQQPMRPGPDPRQVVKDAYDRIADRDASWVMTGPPDAAVTEHLALFAQHVFVTTATIGAYSVARHASG
jgi:hypothetical protein